MSTPHGPKRTSPGSIEHVEDLLAELERRVGKVRDAWQSGEAAQARAIAGELLNMTRASSRDDVSRSAAEIEQMLLAEEAEASALCEKVEALIALCRRVGT